MENILVNFFFSKDMYSLKNVLKTAYKICILYLGLAFDINRRIN